MFSYFRVRSSSREDLSEQKKLPKKGNLHRSASENNGKTIDKRYVAAHSTVKMSLTHSRTEIQRNIWTSTSLPSSSRTRSDAVAFRVPHPINTPIPPMEQGFSGSNSFGVGHIKPSVPPKTSRKEAHNKTKYKVKKTNKRFDNTGNESLPIYQTHSKNRGLALIVNNVKFHEEELYRKGAKKDEKDIADVLKQIGFDVERFRDVKKTDIQRILKRFTKEPKLSKADICLVVVMSHGTNNKIPGGYTELMCVEGEKISTENIIDYFNESECTRLKNKPKVFIFQCCRNSPYENDKVSISKKPQDKSNTLIAYSTIPGFSSHRHVEDGTWYIQTICKVFSEHAHQYHIEDLLKMVDNEMKKLDPHLKQVSSYENRGFLHCYLHPR
ncbi:caspase-3-like isoform X2 [Coccinella septempunctata]|uniref:caspase-3-like isoform X2 n=1 Tax=Coccinella septempunctata TaxID=41139 RepID=UPI001D08769E|nr:caspase-3-like isoform X2 [Coccinella septempunctata]